MREGGRGLREGPAARRSSHPPALVFRLSHSHSCAHVPAGVLVAFVVPGALGMSLGEELTERAGARTMRAVVGGVLIFVGVVVGVCGIIRVIAYTDPLAG